MATAQIKLNEIIRLCTDLSTTIHNNTNSVNTPQKELNLSEDKISYDIISKKKKRLF